MPSERRCKPRPSEKALLTSRAVMFRCAKVITNLFVRQIVRISRIPDHGNIARGSIGATRRLPLLPNS
jgi:hypothetical protein